MNGPQLFGIVMGILTAILIPLGVSIVRAEMKWSRLESKVDGVIEDIKGLVHDKDRVHLAIMEDIKTDREATNKRLRWLEEYVWEQRGKSRAVRDPES